MARLLRDENVSLSLDEPHWSSLANRTAQTYFAPRRIERIGGLRAGITVGNHDVTLMTHPLWESGQTHHTGVVPAPHALPIHPSIKRAIEEAESQGLNARSISLFDMVRFPFL